MSPSDPDHDASYTSHRGATSGLRPLRFLLSAMRGSGRKAFTFQDLLQLVKTPTVRLAFVQAVVMFVFVASLLAYIYHSTAGQLLRDSDIAADQEYAALERAYVEGGMRRLQQEVIERSARRGPMHYLLVSPEGEVIAGDIDSMPATPEDVSMRVDWSFDRGGDPNRGPRGRARGRIGRLLHGPVLLVARDLGDTAAMARRITNVLWTVAVFALLLSALSGLFIAWQAAKRLEALSTTAREVMAGDLSRRAPVGSGRDEFDALAMSINAMLDRIETLVQTTRTAGDAIAHDLRTPLSRFRQRLETALDTPPDSERDRQALQKAVMEADRLVDMFEGVLKLARLETASHWRFQRVDLSKIAEALAEFYEPVAEERGQELIAQIEPGLELSGDQGLVTQAVSNLIENALKYTPEGGRIEVRAMRRLDQRVEIIVLDDGPGVPLHDRERVIERFVRLESARTTPGAGLGLALVHAVARLHRGGLHLRDGLHRAGPGLAAALVLPAASSWR